MKNEYKAINIKNQIEKRLNEKGLKKNILKRGTLDHMSSSFPKADTLSNIADILGCSVDFLVGRSENPESHLQEASKLSHRQTQLIEDFEKSNVTWQNHILKIAELAASDSSGKSFLPELSETVKIKIPLFDIPVSAGSGNFLDYSAAELIEIDETSTNKKADFAVNVSGNSMFPLFSENDILLIEKTNSIDLNDIGVFIYDNKVFVKKYSSAGLASINPTYETLPFIDNMKILGKVVGKIDKEK